MLNNQNIEGERLDYQLLFRKCSLDMREQGVIEPKKDTHKFSSMYNSFLTFPSFLHKTGYCHSIYLSSQYDSEIFPYKIHFPIFFFYFFYLQYLLDLQYTNKYGDNKGQRKNRRRMDN